MGAKLVDLPSISVIVTAHNRRRYLPFALRSLEAQTLPKDKFEVVVVKNFEDPESDSIISRNGWRSVYNDELYHGRKILAGLEEAKGDVITFLEDDDMYVNSRLAEVNRAFTTYKGLVYFHNSQTVVDKEGREAPEVKLRVSKNIIKAEDIVISVEALREVSKRYKVDLVGFVPRFVRVSADFNGSSMAVRRETIEAVSGLLRELPIGIDVFTFSSALKAGGLLYFTDRRLTLYRVHGENWSSTPAVGGRLEVYVLWRARARLQAALAYRVIGSLLGDDTNYYLCHELINRGGFQYLPLPELGTLPQGLRLSPSHVGEALRCYRAGTYSLAIAIFVMGQSLLGPLLAPPKARRLLGEALVRLRRLARGWVSP
jgi:glycosyltransferase involved in cell wall biosynthesis